MARAALELFAARGFEATTLGDVAAAVGLHRRSLFRYFPSKNDMVWGDFDSVLERLRACLHAADDAEPLMPAIGHAVVESNRYPDDQLGELRIRMRLITTVPSLQAHSMLRYAAWRSVIAEFAARRLELSSDTLVPQTIGHVALGTSMAAFSCWVRSPADDLEANLRRGFALLADGFAGART